MQAPTVPRACVRTLPQSRACRARGRRRGGRYGRSDGSAAGYDLRQRELSAPGRVRWAGRHRLPRHRPVVDRQVARHGLGACAQGRGDGSLRVPEVAALSVAGKLARRAVGRPRVRLDQRLPGRDDAKAGAESPEQLAERRGLSRAGGSSQRQGTRIRVFPSATLKASKTGPARCVERAPGAMAPAASTVPSADPAGLRGGCATAGFLLDLDPSLVRIPPRSRTRDATGEQARAGA